MEGVPTLKKSFAVPQINRNSKILSQLDILEWTAFEVLVEFFFLVVSLSSIHMLKWNCIEIYENKRDIRKTVRVCLNCNYSNLTVIKL